MKKNTNIKIPISIGELIDKITILEIKYINIECKEKREHIWKELEALFYIYNNKISCIDKCKKYKEDLYIINNELWKIEDAIRIKEKNDEFDEYFIELARNVYYQNDKRFELKNKINMLFNSNITEVKSYQSYK